MGVGLWLVPHRVEHGGQGAARVGIGDDNYVGSALQHLLALCLHQLLAGVALLCPVFAAWKRLQWVADVGTGLAVEIHDGGMLPHVAQVCHRDIEGLMARAPVGDERLSLSRPEGGVERQHGNGDHWQCRHDPPAMAMHKPYGECYAAKHRQEVATVEVIEPQ